ncbi:MAG: carboxylating nicotinate-nucleotide diphosphorylase [Acidimicrobiales bacterium]|jgi:nicotinate-nucleotide pyrophosphorylase (carboxylating)
MTMSAPPYRDDVHPPAAAVREAVTVALAEDLLPLGDLSAALLPEQSRGRAAFVARASGVVAGTRCVEVTCSQVDPDLEVTWLVGEGGEIGAGGVIGRVEGRLRSLLTAERTALNFLCHLSGVATSTRRYVEAAKDANPFARIWDTRKTTPGLRSLEKAAVRAGGAANHRGSLSEGVLIKDNHLVGLSISDAVCKALEWWPGRMVEVECERPAQVSEALDAGATLVMCDNMTPDEVRACVQLVRSHPRGATGSVLVEASGGVNLENVAAYARAGADVISVGALTHSVIALDIGLDLESVTFGAG